MMSRAFSLIEVMVAVALFAVGIASIFQSFATAGRLSRHERHTTAALHAGERVMEDMLLRRIDDPIFNLTSLHCFDAAAQPADCFDGASYEVEVSLQPTLVVGLFDLTTTVLWREDGGRHQLVLGTRRY